MGSIMAKLKIKLSQATYVVFSRFFPQIFKSVQKFLFLATRASEDAFDLELKNVKLHVEKPSLALISILCCILCFGLGASLWLYEKTQRGRILGQANIWASVMFLDAVLLHCLWEDQWLFSTVFYLLDVVPTALAGFHLCFYVMNFEIPTFLLLTFDASLFYYAYVNQNTLMIELIYLLPLVLAGLSFIGTVISSWGWTRGKWIMLAMFMQQLMAISIGFDAKLVNIDPRLNNVNIFFASTALMMLCIVKQHWVNFPPKPKLQYKEVKVEVPAKREQKQKRKGKKGKRNSMRA